MGEEGLSPKSGPTALRGAGCVTAMIIKASKPESTGQDPGRSWNDAPGVGAASCSNNSFLRLSRLSGSADPDRKEPAIVSGDCERLFPDDRVTGGGQLK